MTAPLPISEAEPTALPSSATQSIAEIFPLRVQASLFLLLLAFLGFIGWKTWQPALPRDGRTSPDHHGKIDLNRAGRAELLLLHGVGPELADRILAQREKHGPFEGLHDLRKVPGIGPATLDKFRPQIVLSWPERVLPNETPGASVLTIAPAAFKAKADEATALLDPNRATLAELETLPGIGPKLAQRIVDRRTKTPFAEVSDLRKVPGIGPKTLDKIKPRLRIGDGMSARLQ